MDRGASRAAVHGVTVSQTQLSNFTFTFHFHALEKEMATHFSVLAWRIPGMGEPGGPLSMGLHRVGHNWSYLAAAAAHASKVILKILQARLQQYVNHELPEFQAGFRKGKRTRVQIAQHPLDHQKSKRVLEKHLILLYWLYQSLWLCGSQQTVENSSRDENTRPPYLPPEKSVWRLRSNS